MGEDRALLRGGEPGAVIDDIEQCRVDFSDVVKEGDSLEGADLMAAEVRGVTEDQRVASHAPEMLPRLVVRRLDGVEQRLERRRGKTLGARATDALETKQPE